MPKESKARRVWQSPAGCGKARRVWQSPQGVAKPAGGTALTSRRPSVNGSSSLMRWNAVSSAFVHCSPSLVSPAIPCCLPRARCMLPRCGASRAAATPQDRAAVFQPSAAHSHATTDGRLPQVRARARARVGVRVGVWE